MAESEKGISKMRTFIKTPIKKAEGGTSTVKQIHQKQFYRNDIPQSNLKLQIGQLMFYLQKPLNQYEQKVCWQILETTLRKYYEVKRIRQ